MMSGLPREVLKWLQSLDLSRSIKNSRRDFSNGYLIAEIFSWYYPRDFQMHSFHNGMSTETKTGNWSIIKRFFVKEDFDIPKDEIEGTIHCKPNAAVLLVSRIYTTLTNREVKARAVESNADFTDNSYQSQLPLHARSTASQAIKNNIANSELHTDPDWTLCRQKVQEVIRVHVNNRQSQRSQDPERFGIKPSICQTSPRKTPSEDMTEEEQENYYRGGEMYEGVHQSKELDYQEYLPEISVKQPAY